MKKKTVVVALMIILGVLLLCLGMAIAGPSDRYSVTLEWNPNSEPTLAGYRLWWGPAPRYYTNCNIVLAPATQNVVSNLVAGRYYFAVTAFLADSLESDYSEEVSAGVGLPKAPTGLRGRVWRITTTPTQ